MGHHGISAAMIVDTDRGDPQGSISYAYGRLPFDFRTSFYRSLSPINYSASEPVFTRQSLGMSSGISYSLPSEFESNNFAFSYSLSRFDGAIPLSRTPDPFERLHGDPPRGQIGSIHMGWNYSNVEGTLHGVGPERGFSLSLSADIADPMLASDYTLYVFGYSANKYIPMPWGHHHTLALHGASAISTGNYPYLGPFYNGGFLDAPLFQSYTLNQFQGPFVLRGYPYLEFSGRQYHLYNAEYRFPILNVDHGISTFPAFVQRINGALFADYGGAFNDIDAHNWRDKFHLGFGAELSDRIYRRLLFEREPASRLRAPQRPDLRRVVVSVLTRARLAISQPAARASPLPRPQQIRPPEGLEVTTDASCRTTPA